MIRTDGNTQVRAKLNQKVSQEYGSQRQQGHSIAKYTQTSHPFVAKVRLAVTGNISSERVYTTKHGTPATMNISRIGKKSVADLPPRWLGLKPSLAMVRWAVLEETGGTMTMPILLDYGTIQTAKKRPTFERLWELERDLVALLEEFKPTAIATRHS